MVVASVGLLVVVHEPVEVGEVAVQVNVPGVASAHQVAVELRTLSVHKSHTRFSQEASEARASENAKVLGAKRQSF